MPPESPAAAASTVSVDPASEAPPTARPAGPRARRGLLRRPRPRWLSSKNWDEHVDDLEQMASSPGFLALRDEIIAGARLQPQDRVLDVGAGTGLLALAAAPAVAHVSALDISPAMGAHLERKLHDHGIANASVITSSAAQLPLADASVDVVLSNYCFHHLRDADKELALREIRRVLVPGGRLVFGDMMFRLGVASRRDREVISTIVKRIIRRGPAGLLRLARNALRIISGRWEHPASVEWWQDALQRTGFDDVHVRALAHEGGIACAHRPDEPA